MELTQRYTLPVPPQRAWDALTDAATLRAAIPGCESIEADGDQAFAFSVNTSLDGVKARFRGRMRMTASDAPRACTLRFESEAGSAAGDADSARLTLEADGDGATTLSCDMPSASHGNGQRQPAADPRSPVHKLTEEFVKRFAAHVSSGDGALDAAGDAPLPSDPSVQHAAVAESAPTGKGAKSWKMWNGA